MANTRWKSKVRDVPHGGDDNGPEKFNEWKAAHPEIDDEYNPYREIVNTASYVSKKDRIEALMLAGKNLQVYRESL